MLQLCYSNFNLNNSNKAFLDRKCDKRTQSDLPKILTPLGIALDFEDSRSGQRIRNNKAENDERVVTQKHSTSKNFRRKVSLSGYLWHFRIIIKDV